jgi:glycosyl transferase family 1
VEGIALAIYEAMSCGVAVVGTDVGGQRELVTPECGVLVRRSEEEGEARQYAEVLAGLVGDPGRRAGLGQAGRRRVEAEFRLAQMGERMVELIGEARELHERRPRAVPSVGVGRVCAAQAIEATRLTGEINSLWGERPQQGSLGPLSLLRELPGGQWRISCYFALRRLGLRYYQAGLGKNMKWLLPVKNTVKRVLLGEIWS